MLYLINALLEVGEYNYIEKLVDKVIDEDLKLLFNSYYNLFVNKKNYLSKDSANKFKLHYGQEFIKYIKNKRIVINAPSNVQKFNHIKDNDILVGMNFFKKQNRENS